MARQAAQSLARAAFGADPVFGHFEGGVADQLVGDWRFAFDPMVRSLNADMYRALWSIIEDFNRRTGLQVTKDDLDRVIRVVKDSVEEDVNVIAFRVSRDGTLADATDMRDRVEKRMRSPFDSSVVATGRSPTRRSA